MSVTNAGKNMFAGVDSWGQLYYSLPMDKQIRVTQSTHKTLQEHATSNRGTLKHSAEVAAAALFPYVVVARGLEGVAVVEAFTRRDLAQDREAELKPVFGGDAVSIWSRECQDCLPEMRKYGPGWIEATGWAP